MTAISTPKLTVLALTVIAFWWGFLLAIDRNNQLDARIFIQSPIVQTCVQHNVMQRVTVSP